MYYLGNWAKDIYDNYTMKQAERIFAKVDKLKSELTFFQVKIPTFKDEDGKEWAGFEYYAKKFRFTKIKIFLSVITISFVLFLTGTFFPNPYTKHLIKKM
jgi:hypothetical protein